MDALAGRVRNMIGRAIVRLIDDTQQAQSLQIELLADEVQDGAERLQNYGFTSHPHPGAEAVGVFPAGLRSHGIVIAVEDRRYRLTGLEQGEVAMFDDLGNVIKLGRTAIEVTAVADITVTAAGDASLCVQGNADLQAGGDVSVTAEASATVTAASVVVDSDDVQLGGAGGAAIARVGDSVDLVSGLILSGSAKVTAA
ncbi:phage baseplate assembly protein V [Novosphingobium naphthalenivorans]|uniref:phage baseplate assembly protein V n=1 Tax=Novosphingobium naphthalenivorans TaxID=273168 RepID=UPI00082CF9E4|nr:phage baseplate assembly protein V [Novosphingobium naphthalenivorans]